MAAVWRGLILLPQVRLTFSVSSPRKLYVTSKSLMKFSLNSGYCFNMCSVSSREIMRSSQYVNARMLARELTTGLLGSIAKFSPNESPLPWKKNFKRISLFKGKEWGTTTRFSGLAVIFFSFLMWIFLHSKMETWVRVRKTSIEHAQMCLCFVWRFNTQTSFPKFSGTDKCAASVFKHRELLQHMEKEWKLSYTFKQQPSFKVPCLDLKFYSCDCCQ